MWNVRVRPALETLATNAIQTIGTDRSTFMREALEEKALRTLAGPTIRRGNETAKNDEPPRPKVKVEECEHPKENVNFIPGVNLKLCTLCGARF